jgi:exopolysaccharide production protein ExoZ
MNTSLFDRPAGKRQKLHSLYCPCTGLAPCRVSVVIKALNEEKRIEATVESALRAVAGVGGEVILADSYSSDRTVELAGAYPIRIVQLANPEERCCGAGPQLGYQHSRGDFVYILDGDMQMREGFLEQALAFLDTHADVAGVGGRVVEQNTESLEYMARGERASAHLQPGNVDRLDGGGLYRRSAIEAAGYFSDRNLHSYEEFDLAIRLRALGWRLWRCRWTRPTISATTRRPTACWCGAGARATSAAWASWCAPRPASRVCRWRCRACANCVFTWRCWAGGRCWPAPAVAAAGILAPGVFLRHRHRPRAADDLAQALPHQGAVFGRVLVLQRRRPAARPAAAPAPRARGHRQPRAQGTGAGGRTLKGATQQFTGVQVLRFAAAMLVVVMHITQAISIHITGTGPSHYWGAGSAGVDIFFVISGFVMAMSTSSLPAAGPARLPQLSAAWVFMRRRLLRIAPLYWFYTLLKVALLLAMPALAARSSVEPGHLAASLFFIPAMSPWGLVQPTLPVGWTLNFEMLFYAVFAAAIALGAPRIRFCLAAFARGLPGRLPSAGFGGAEFLRADHRVRVHPRRLHRACLPAFRRAAPLAGLVVMAAGALFMFAPDWGHTADRFATWGCGAALVVLGAVWLEPWTAARAAGFAPVIPG